MYACVRACAHVLRVAFRCRLCALHLSLCSFPCATYTLHERRVHRVQTPFSELTNRQASEPTCNFRRWLISW